MDSADKKEFGGGLEIQKIKTAAIGWKSAVQNLFIDVGTGNDPAVAIDEVRFFVVLKGLANPGIRRIGPSDFQSAFPMELFFMTPVAASVLKQGFDCAGIAVGYGPDQHIASIFVLLIEGFDGNKDQSGKCSCGIVSLDAVEKFFKNRKKPPCARAAFAAFLYSASTYSQICPMASS